MTGTGNRQRPAARWRALVLAACLSAVVAACGGSAPAKVLPALAGSPQLTSGVETAHTALGAFAVQAVTAPTATARAQAALNAAILLHQASSDAQVATYLQFAIASSPAQGAMHTSASFLLARELAPNDPATAAGLLKPLADSKGPLEPYVLAQYASALDAQGKASSAVKQWKKVLALDSPPLALEEQAYRALAADADRASDRQAWLTKLVKLTGDASDRMTLAQAARDAGDMTTFKSQLHTVITSDPGTHEAVLAVQALKADGIAVDPGDEALVDYRHSDFAGVEKLLTAAATAPGTTPAQQTFRLYYLAAAYESEGKKALAIATYDRAAATGANSPFVHRARYWAAEVMETTGDTKDAAARYAALAKDGPAGEFTSEAAFEAGDLLLQAGDPAGAVTAWDSLGTSTDPKVLYWKGRAAQSAGMAAVAQASFQAAAKAGPFDFYGLQAQAALSGTKFGVAYQPRTLPTTVDWDAVSAWLAKLKGAGTIPPPATAAAQLAAIGLRDDAQRALLDAGDGAGPWAMLGLIHEAREAALDDVAATLTSELAGNLGIADQQLPKPVLQLEYPVSYVQLIAQKAETQGIDPLFLAATIYQESAWNPEAGSTAGAIGLLQLVPATATEVGKQQGFGAVTAADLFQPGLNLELGAAFLGAQMTAFGDPALALAAYNAGPGNAARWQQGWDGTDAATLVAKIDYTETASYVEQIYQTYAFYKLAYGGGQ